RCGPRAVAARLAALLRIAPRRRRLGSSDAESGLARPAPHGRLARHRDPHDHRGGAGAARCRVDARARATHPCASAVFSGRDDASAGRGEVGVSRAATSTRAFGQVDGPGVVGAVRVRAWPLAIGCAMTVWALSLFVVVRDHYVNFRLARYDLGNMVQAVWSTA